MRTEELDDWIADAGVIQRALARLTDAPGWADDPDTAAAVRGLIELLSRPLTNAADHMKDEARAEYSALKRFYERTGRLPQGAAEHAAARADYDAARATAGRAATADTNRSADPAYAAAESAQAAAAPGDGGD